MSTEPAKGVGAEASGGSVADGVGVGAAVVGAVLEVSGVDGAVEVEEDGDEVETGSVVDVVGEVVNGVSVIVAEVTTVSVLAADAPDEDGAVVGSAVELERTEVSLSEADAAVSGAGLSEPQAVARQSANAMAAIRRGRCNTGAGISRELPSSEGDSRAQFAWNGRALATS